MKTAATIARYLLGVMFVVFGANGFLHFINPPPPSSPLAVQYMTSLAMSHYFAPVFLLQFICGVLFLAGRYLPLTLTLIAPVIVNILFFHIFMDPGGIGPGLLATILWTLVFVRERHAFRGLFQARTAADT